MITEIALDPALSWVVAAGPRDTLFRELGDYAAADVHAVLDSMPERDGLDRFAATPEGAATLRRIVDATRERFPAESRELDDLAAGAGRDVDQVWLANLRGDLGGDDGTGCSDLSWRGNRSIVAHNEDGAPNLAGRFRLLTLLVDGEVPVTTGWYPGFLPANTNVVTGHGLAWGINHVQVGRAAVAPGRAFVARAAQHLTSLTAVVEHLRGEPSAGGFAYTVGERGTGEIAVVETAAGRSVVTSPGAEAPLQWHTNHLRWVGPADDAAEPVAPAVPSAVPDAAALGQLGGELESRERGALLDGLQPLADPDASWFRGVMAESPLPRGVRRNAAGTDPLMTLCTTIVDLTAEQVTIISRAGIDHTLAWDDVANGRPPTTPTTRSTT